MTKEPLKYKIIEGLIKIAIFSFFIMVAWNSSLSGLCKLPEINYFQAAWLKLLVNFLFEKE